MSELTNINCRICLRYDLERSQKCLSLFEKYNNSLISEKIKYVANIEIEESDGLPDKICPDCLLQLETAIVFKQKCETSNKILLSVIQQSSKVPKLTFRVPVKEEIDVLLDRTDDYSIQYSVTEPETNKLEISKDEIVEVEAPSNVLTKGPVDKTSRNKKHVNKNSENKELVLLKNEEIEYEMFNSEEFVIEMLEKKEIEIETLKNEDDSQETENAVEVVRKSRAIDLKLICDDCGGSFKSKCKLAVHWKKVHLYTKLLCPNCKRQFKSFKAFNVHKKKGSRSCNVATKVRIEGQGKKRVFHCNDCVYKSKSIKDMGAHLVTHSGDRRYQCKDCFKCFTQHSSLQGHRESQHKDYRVQATCHYCGKFIKGRNKFYKHLRIHEPKCVQCEVCKKTLRSKTTLINHMKRHSGVKSYTCEKCSANFYTLGELCNHRKRVHFKAKTFKCDMCAYTAYTAKLLKMHRSRHTQSNVACLLCGIFVENAEKLVIHQKRHAEKNFCCPHPQCDKGFYRRDSLRRHMVKKHAVPKKQDPNKVKTVNIKPETEHKIENYVITLNPILS